MESIVKKATNFIVMKSKIILLLFVLFALLSIWLMTKVNINTDMTKYLPNDSQTKIGIDIMEEEFSTACSLNLMLRGLSSNDKLNVYNSLLDIENVQSVIYDLYSEKYNKDDYTLYTISIGYNAYSSETKAVVDSIKEKYSTYEIAMSGEAAGKNLDYIMSRIVFYAGIILFVILFLMCNSWIEPFLFIITIAVAILINMGTNIIFSSVSDITQAIGAVLQLVLSMDYSIMLLNRYRQEKQLTDDKYEAMKKSLRKAFVAISSSSVTTIVGMLALIFMSFTIGKDLGLVLAKGVFFSLLCIFTVLPALILIFDNTIERTSKKSLHIKMNKLASFSYSSRKFISAGFLVLLVISFLIKGNVSIDYTLTDFNYVTEVFTLNNPIIVLYENSDEEAVSSISYELSNNSLVDSIVTYSTTLGMELTYKELAVAAGMDETLAALAFNYYFDDENNNDKKIAFGEFIRFLKEDVAANEQFAPFFTDEMMAQLNAFSDMSEQVRLSSDEFAYYSGMDADAVIQIYNYYFMLNGQSEDNKIALNDLVQFLMTTIATDPQFAPLFTEDVIAQLSQMNSGTDNSIMEQELSFSELAAYIEMDEAIVKQLYNYYAVIHGDVPNGKISLYDFMSFMINETRTNELFKLFLTDEIMLQLDSSKTELDDGLGQMVGENYSRLIINTYFEEESVETFNFIENLEQKLNDTLEGNYYIVGNSAIAYEMSNSFPKEMNFITILTAVAIFIVVAVSFRSLAIPSILVLIIQCAVFITMGTVYLQGGSIYYLPLLIVQCLLMGATIDYGILYTSYYREARDSYDRKESVAVALNNAIHTILTSASILIVVTGVLGFMLSKSDNAISEILLTIARGSLCSTVLVVFILPSIMSAMDSFVWRKNK